MNKSEVVKIDVRNLRDIHRLLLSAHFRIKKDQKECNKMTRAINDNFKLTTKVKEQS